MEQRDDAFEQLVDSSIDLLKFGYTYFDKLSISNIDALADLIFTHYVEFDGEFKTICYEWEYRHKNSTGTEFQEDYIR